MNLSKNLCAFKPAEMHLVGELRKKKTPSLFYNPISG